MKIVTSIAKMQELARQFRGGGLQSDSAEVEEIRRRHWFYYWDDKRGNLPEDIEAYESQQRAMQNEGVGYSLIARGETGHTGLRGDDNRRISGAAVLPTGGAGLWIEVDDDGLVTQQPCGNGQVNGESGFSRAAFLG